MQYYNLPIIMNLNKIIVLSLFVLFRIIFVSCSDYETAYYEDLDLTVGIKYDRYYELVLSSSADDVRDTIYFEANFLGPSPILYLIPPDKIFFYEGTCVLEDAKMHNFKLRLYDCSQPLLDLLGPDGSDSTAIRLLPYPKQGTYYSRPSQRIFMEPYYELSYYGKLSFRSADGTEIQKSVIRQSKWHKYHF